MFEPTGWFFLTALVIAFAALLYWLAKATQIVWRITAGVLAFAVSAFFGAALVNQHYAYYTTWTSLVADVSSSGVSAYQPGLAPHANPHPGPPSHDGQSAKPATAPSWPVSTPLASAVVPASIHIGRLGLRAARASGKGRVVTLNLVGRLSGITRAGFVYLPPQYFQPAYATTAFPVLELLHGDPGGPTGWLYSLNVPQVMDREINAGRVGPMVIVMPATFRGPHGQDCVDAPGGQLDDTYLATDVPADVTKAFRVLPQGEHWAIGGLSDGGFCAANLALRHPGRFGAVASMDGFYSASGDLPVLGRIFGWNSPQLRNNDPVELATDTRRTLPRFWLMSGTGNSIDTQAASQFSHVLTSREPIATVIVHGGKHTPSAWRVVLPTLLQWSWNTLSGGPVGCAATSVAMSATPAQSAPASPPPGAPAASSTTPARSAPSGPSPTVSAPAAPRT